MAFWNSPSNGAWLLAVLLALPCPIAAAADKAGEVGPIKSIHLRSTKASSNAFWNWVIITGASGDEIYYWGGSVCPGVKLIYQGNSTLMIDALAEYATNPEMCIEPFYKNGQGGNRCLVSFTASVRTGDRCDARPT